MGTAAASEVRMLLHLQTVYAGQVWALNNDGNGGCSGGSFHAVGEINGAGLLETRGIWAAGFRMLVLLALIMAWITWFLGPSSVPLTLHGFKLLLLLSSSQCDWVAIMPGCQKQNTATNTVSSTPRDRGVKEVGGPLLNIHF